MRAFNEIRLVCLTQTVCLGVVTSFLISASPWVSAGGVRAHLYSADPLPKRLDEEMTSQDGLQQTLNLNFSPEARARIRQALDDYARSADPDHSKIEERRRAMQESIEARFSAADGDNDGSLDRQEATQSLPQVARHFGVVDTNSDEVVTLEELELALARYMERKKITDPPIEPKVESKKVSENQSTEPARRKEKSALNSSRKSSP